MTPKLQRTILFLLLGFVPLALYCKANPSQHKANQLQPTKEEVTLHQPVEFDGWSRKQVYAFRKKRVLLHPELIDGTYQPRAAAFSQIIDKKPWWGMEGQFCYGPGARSTEGASEESRFIGNPFLLLALGESLAYKNIDPCVVAYPQPISLEYSQNQAQATYDITAFLHQVKKAGRKASSKIMIHNYNARDWGYDWIHANSSSGVAAVKKSALFQRPVPMQAFVHVGKSCGQRGGCNNASPYEPHLYFRIEQLPAKIEFFLWKNKPGEIDKADFSFVLQLQ